MTNVKAKDLNYNRYSSRIYDRDILSVIPGHSEMHNKISSLLKQFPNRRPDVLELGIGTGLTAKSVLRSIPNAKYTGIDFSKTMLKGAKSRLRKYDIQFKLKDYSLVKFPKNDIIISVIGIHHQTDKEKRILFNKIFKALKKDGIFIFGDLMACRNKYEAAINEAKHYAYLVKNSHSEKSLKEWSYHHKFLNLLAPLDDQMKWLKQSGFKTVKILYKKYNTVLIFAKK